MNMQKRNIVVLLALVFSLNAVHAATRGILKVGNKADKPENHVRFNENVDVHNITLNCPGRGLEQSLVERKRLQQALQQLGPEKLATFLQPPGSPEAPLGQEPIQPQENSITPESEKSEVPSPRIVPTPQLKAPVLPANSPTQDNHWPKRLGTGVVICGVIAAVGAVGFWVYRKWMHCQQPFNQKSFVGNKGFSPKIKAI